MAAHLERPKLEHHADKLAKMTNLLMKMAFATNAQSTKLSPTENALVSTNTSETPTIKFVNSHAPLLYSNIKEDVPNVQ